MQGICSKVAFGVPFRLVSLTRRLPRLSLVFCVIIYFYLNILCCVVTFLITIETSDMIQVLASRASNVKSIDTGVWGGVFPGLVVI